MRKLLQANRAPAIVLGVLALVVAVGGGAFAASGGGAKTITVCVKKEGGALYQAKKCKQHDKKLTWNQTGPQGLTGANGANGTNGANGANGAVQGYSATKSSSVDITADTSFTTIVSKQLPAGSYIVSGQTVLDGSDTAASPQATSNTCELVDGSTTSQPAQWSSPEGAVFLIHLAQTTLPLQMALTTTATSTVSLKCEDNLTSPPGTYSNGASNSVITAVQASGNS